MGLGTFSASWIHVLFLKPIKGPAFVPSGIFKPAYFVTLGISNSTTTSSSASSVAFSPSVFVEEKSIEISKVGQRPSLRPNETADWLINVTLALRSSQLFDNPTMVVSLPELNITSSPLPLPPIPGDTTESTFVSASVTIADRVPQRWYPHNLGAPKRYNITILLDPANVTFMTTTGFRTIVLMQEPYSQVEVASRGITPGDQFHFEINGKALYSLGTNIIPFDPFYSRTTTERVRWVIESAVLSGQNMVRSLLCINLAESE